MFLEVKSKFKVLTKNPFKILRHEAFTTVKFILVIKGIKYANF